MKLITLIALLLLPGGLIVLLGCLIREKRRSNRPLTSAGVPGSAS
jgi:hypothetical protein